MSTALKRLGFSPRCCSLSATLVRYTCGQLCTCPPPPRALLWMTPWSSTSLPVPLERNSPPALWTGALLPAPGEGSREGRWDGVGGSD